MRGLPSEKDLMKAGAGVGEMTEQLWVSAAPVETSLKN